MSRITPNPDELITQEELAQFAQRSPRTLRLWRVRGVGPKYVRIGGRGIRYRWADWLTYIEGSTVDPKEATT